MLLLRNEIMISRYKINERKVKNYFPDTGYL